MKIQKMRQSDEGFWDLIGPFFASAETRKSMGVTMSSDESYKWFIAIDKDDEVLGFCSVAPDSGKVFRIRYAHVVVDDLKLKEKLIEAASKDGPAIKKSMVGKDFSCWESVGFEYTGKEKGRFKEMNFKRDL